MRTFFGGDSNADPREFDGVNVRLTGDQQLQLASGGATLTLADLDGLIDDVQGTQA